MTHHHGTLRHAVRTARRHEYRRSSYVRREGDVGIALLLVVVLFCPPLALILLAVASRRRLARCRRLPVAGDVQTPSTYIQQGLHGWRLLGFDLLLGAGCLALIYVCSTLIPAN